MKKCATNRSLAKWVFLGLITLNIYNIVVMSRLGKDLNHIQMMQEVPGKRLKPYFPSLLLGIITLGIYPLVWEIKAISRVYTYADKAFTPTYWGPKKVSLYRTLLIWTIVCPLLAISKLFKTANLVCKWYNNQLDNQLDSFLTPDQGDYIDLPELLGEDHVEEEAKPSAPEKAEEKERTTAKAEEEKTEEKPMAKPAAKPAAKKPAAKPAAKPAPKAAAKPEPKEGKRVYHVAKREDGMWAVKFAGGEKAIKLFKTKVEAEAYTKQMAKNQGGVMLTHNSKGANKGKIAKK